MPHISVLSNMKIAVVDDHELLREGLNVVLARYGSKEIAKYATGTALIKDLDGGKSFDVYIVDLELPDVDGFVLIEMIRARDRNAKIIVNTVHDEIWTLRKLLARDVNAITYKSGDGAEMVEALKAVGNGEYYYCEDVNKALKAAVDSSQHPTSRELEVLDQIAQGKTSREIAAAMFVSDNTVEAHRKALFAKLGAVNVADLIFKAVEKGYIMKNTQRR